MLRLGEPNQTASWKQLLIDISGQVAPLFKPIFALKPCNQDSRFDYHKSHKQIEKLFTKFRRVPQKWPKKPNLREIRTWSGQTGIIFIYLFIQSKIQDLIWASQSEYWQQQHY